MTLVSHSLTQTLSHSLTQLLTQTPNDSLTHSLTHSYEYLSGDARRRLGPSIGTVAVGRFGQVVPYILVKNGEKCLLEHICLGESMEPDVNLCVDMGWR